MRIITVVMNEPDSTTRNSETTSMLNYGFSMYGMDNLLTIDTVLTEAKVNLGKDEYVEIVPVKDVNILNSKNTDKREVTYNLELYDIKAPVKKGDVVGKINVIENGKTIMEVDATVRSDVEKANIFEAFVRNLSDIITGKMSV